MHPVVHNIVHLASSLLVFESQCRGQQVKEERFFCFQINFSLFLPEEYNNSSFPQNYIEVLEKVPDLSEKF